MRPGEHTPIIKVAVEVVNDVAVDETTVVIVVVVVGAILKI